MTSIPDMVVVQARPPMIFDELRGLISEGNGNKTYYNIIICFMLWYTVLYDIILYTVIRYDLIRNHYGEIYHEPI